MATVDQIKTRAAQKIGILPAGDVLSDEDSTLLGGVYETLHALLLDQGLVTWSDPTGEVPDEVSEAMASMLASETCEDYGCDAAKVQRLQTAAWIDLPGKPSARAWLARFAAVDYVPADEAVDY